jgi:hypothetical protein
MPTTSVELSRRIARFHNEYCLVLFIAHRFGESRIAARMSHCLGESRIAITSVALP